MENGVFFWGVFFNDFMLYMVYILEFIRKFQFNGIKKVFSLLKFREKEDYFMIILKDKLGSFVVNVLLFLFYKEFGILNVMMEKNVFREILNEQGKMGDWRDNIGIIFVIVFVLVRYYQFIGDEMVLEFVKKVVIWFKDQQDEEGRFKVENYFYVYLRISYVQMVYIYYVVGFEEQVQKMFDFIMKIFDLIKEMYLFDVVVLIYCYMMYVYGSEKVIEFLNFFLSSIFF